MKRRAWVRVSWEMLPLVMKGHDVCGVTSTLPEDAEVEHIVVDDQRRELRVYLTSEAFEPVPELGLIPEVKVELTRHYPEPDSIRWPEHSRWPGATS